MTSRHLFIAIALLCSHIPVQADPPHWTYEEQDQPGGWGAIEGTETPAPYNYPYAECVIGEKQTPVDITEAVKVTDLNGMTFDWKPFKADFFNTGHAIQVQPVDANHYSGHTRIGRQRYPLLQAHLHAPGEHTLNGQKYDAEMHFVHIRDDGQIVVVGLLLETGQANEQIQLMLDNTPNTPEEKTHNPTAISFSPMRLLPRGAGSRRFFTYSGSLTTPPCTEGVDWYVYEKPITLSAEQLEQLQGFYNGNDRHVQPLNFRKLMSNRN